MLGDLHWSRLQQTGSIVWGITRHGSGTAALHACCRLAWPLETRSDSFVTKAPEGIQVAPLGN